MVCVRGCCAAATSAKIVDVANTAIRNVANIIVCLFTFSHLLHWRQLIRCGLILIFRTRINARVNNKTNPFVSQTCSSESSVKDDMCHPHVT